MIDMEQIDKMVRGWGLQLDRVEAERLLERMLWECVSLDEFRQRCEFIFDSPPIASIWSAAERSVTVLICGEKIAASV